MENIKCLNFRIRDCCNSMEYFFGSQFVNQPIAISFSWTTDISSFSKKKIFFFLSRTFFEPLLHYCYNTSDIKLTLDKSSILNLLQILKEAY